ncbi:hypothetical protein ABMA70_07310 [Halobacteriovorax sp. XZX-3]|uniref:hypothetical protein n=1 Tax=unclassified Halobacteriovorax TaxID=2639665 RepID=UPI000CD11648|nr:hypothetical protein [Halobacteriovorax sp. DA5]POB12866.1 hypothetical protein C0Z22_13390 [Halobacteriovorax sp. DA5]
MKTLLVILSALLLSASTFAGNVDSELEERLNTIKNEIYHQEQESSALDIVILKKQKSLNNLLLKRQILVEETALQHVISKLEDRLDYKDSSSQEEKEVLETLNILLELSTDERQEVIDRFYEDHKDNRE